MLPVDAVVAKKFAAHAPSRVVSVDQIADDDMILDIGPRSIEYVVSVLARVRTLVWNGPFGAFEYEPFDNGTVEVAEAVAELTQAGRLVSFAGGGDTVAALNVAGVTGRLTHVSTAGGAFLEALEGKTLPGRESVTGNVESNRRAPIGYKRRQIRRMASAEFRGGRDESRGTEQGRGSHGRPRPRHPGSRRIDQHDQEALRRHRR